MAAEGVFGAARHDDPELRRHDIQPFGAILTDQDLFQAHVSGDQRRQRTRRRVQSGLRNATVGKIKLRGDVADRDIGKLGEGRRTLLLGFQLVDVERLDGVVGLGGRC